jgi:tetraacyldisaccharide 4'-kinase
MREPAFWWRAPSLTATLLAPIAGVYGAVAAMRLRHRGRRAAVPVLCVGNFTAGGAGKTPTALALADLLAAAGERPAFLTRGYGGRLAGPLLVDPTRHRADDVGDEPLLLARTAATVVARSRVPGAAMAAGAGASVIVMDDGFQNPSLAKDLAVVVVDGQRGIGNGRVIPAGPLRAPFDAQLARADAVIVVGDVSGAADVVAAARRRKVPVFAARLVPDAGFIAALGGGRVLAFAGIADPRKLFWTLTGAGVAVAAVRSFPDHHPFTPAEAEALCRDAERDGLVLVTTEKDCVRLAGDPRLAELAAHAHALPVALTFEDKEGLRKLVLDRLAAARTTSNN